MKAVNVGGISSGYSLNDGNALFMRVSAIQSQNPKIILYTPRFTPKHPLPQEKDPRTNNQNRKKQETNPAEHKSERRKHHGYNRKGF